MSTADSGWTNLTQAYKGYLRRRGRSENTVRAFDCWFRDFDRYLARLGIEVESVSSVQLERWQEGLAARSLAPRTQQLAATSVRNAIRWAIQRRSWDFDQPDVWEALAAPRAPKLLPRPLPRATVDRITAYLAPRRINGDLYFYRTRAMWFYMVTTGARVSEVLSLERDDLAHDGPVVRQKGGSQKALWAPPAAMGAVLDYVRRRDDDHPALWVTHGNPPVRSLAPAGVREQWHQLADRLSIPRWTTHQLRHTCATELLDAGVPPEVVAAHLGHHGLASLAGYGEVRLGRRQLAVQAMEDRFARMKPDGMRVVALKGGRGRRTEIL